MDGLDDIEDVEASKDGSSDESSIEAPVKTKRKIILEDDSDEEGEAQKEAKAKDSGDEDDKPAPQQKKSRSKPKEDDEIEDEDDDESSDDDEDEKSNKSKEENEDDDDHDIINDDKKTKSDKKKKDNDDEEDEEDDDDDDDDDDNDDDNDDDDDDEDGGRNRSQEAKNTTLYDFDIMMAKKKEENSRKRRRRNYDIINDNDDIIADIINQMKEAFESDIEANKNKMAATRKLKLLPFVISQLRKVDLKDAFLDSDVLSVITEWLAPLPDKSLPHLNIRESFLKLLIEFNLYDVDRIKGSGIGKAIMYLYKHPKETKENKARAKQLISCWSRPIFNLDSSFNSISREEREQRDLELMNKKRRASKQNDDSDDEGNGPSSSGLSKQQKTTGEVAKKPGDKGWIPRARVPAPSMRDYVIRPQSKVDGDVGKSSKRPTNMLEKYMKAQQDLKRANRVQRAVNMKIDRN